MVPEKVVLENPAVKVTLAALLLSNPLSVFSRCRKVPCTRSDKLLLTSARRPWDWICVASGISSLIGLR